MTIHPSHTVIAISLFISSFMLILSTESLAGSPPHDRRTSREIDYVKPWCEARGGILEARMPDNTRCDCLLPGYAVEADYARKWAEAIGQSLHYSRLTGKKAGILLICDFKEIHHLIKVFLQIERYHLPIDVWFIFKEHP